MPGQMILSCPFCHHREEFHDAPPGSTVRCPECKCIFRVPTIGRRLPGTVVRGEQIRSGGKKWLVVLILLLIVGGVGAYVYLKVWAGPPEVENPFAHVKDLYPEQSHPGTLQRFLESWKMGDMKLLMKYCRAEDRPKPDEEDKFQDWLQSMFGNIRLVSYDIGGWKALSMYEQQYRVIIQGVDTRTKINRKGRMAPKVVQERGPDGLRWVVNLSSAVPIWAE